ncbi:MAG: putative 7-carboxy-7-deazaguanine synthase QueE [Clostridiales bacterium]|nr:putative 7-carboxy-7-deazaguanine synthase QueE [Clostridiales bacterium]
MKVVEKFISINGEGPRAGELAVFVRFQGCNLRCSYCDTQWANEKDCPYEEQTPAEIDAYIRATGVTNVTLTGGEPLLQREMGALLALLLRDGALQVEIETNGAVDLAPFCGEHRPVFTMDYKLPASGWEQAMRPENFALLEGQDTVKFVCGSRADLERAGAVIQQYDLTRRCHVYLSPVFGAIDPAEMVDYMIANQMNGVRIQLQMHKFIWDPDRRGV